MVYLYAYLIGSVSLFVASLLLPNKQFDSLFGDSPVAVILTWPLLIILFIIGTIYASEDYLSKSLIHKLRRLIQKAP